MQVNSYLSVLALLTTLHVNNTNSK